MRNFFLKGVAALTMGLAMTACTKDFNYEQEEQQASIDNAQQTLGFYIPDNQDWVLSTTATATFTIKASATMQLYTYSLTIRMLMVMAVFWQVVKLLALLPHLADSAYHST